MNLTHQVIRTEGTARQFHFRSKRHTNHLHQLRSLRLIEWLRNSYIICNTKLNPKQPILYRDTANNPNSISYGLSNQKKKKRVQREKEFKNGTNFASSNQKSLGDLALEHSEILSTPLLKAVNVSRRNSRG